MPYEVFLKKNEEKRILAGHPWVYANEVREIKGEGKNGDLASVFAADGRFLGKGYINHLSKILVRIFIRDDSVPDLDFYVQRIKAANERRLKLGFTDNYRAVFGESDGIPGLIVDRYGDLLSIQILTLGIDKNRETVAEALRTVFKPRGIYERSDVAVREKEGLKPFKGVIYGDFDPVTVIRENDVLMRVDLENGQKTGYFLDQKDNRFAIRRYAKGAEVLDCFCNVGGFSINAAFAGAKSVISADISERALNEVRLNASLNGVSDIVTAKQGDVFELLREYKNEGKMFDLIVLDPPAFCKTQNDVANAYKGYKDINKLAMKLVLPGGFLATASCSHYMTFPLFEKMLKEAASESGRTVRVCEIKTQAPDHSSLITEDESCYLKFFVLSVD